MTLEEIKNEKWRIRDTQDVQGYSSHIQITRREGRYGYWSSIDLAWVGDHESVGHFTRAVDCMNGCDGIDNPERDMAILIFILRSLLINYTLPDGARLDIFRALNVLGEPDQ